MSRVEAIDRDSVVMTLDVYGEMFSSPLDDRVRSIIWRLQRFADSIMPDENVWQWITHQ